MPRKVNLKKNKTNKRKRGGDWLPAMPAIPSWLSGTASDPTKAAADTTAAQEKTEAAAKLDEVKNGGKKSRKRRGIKSRKS